MNYHKFYFYIYNDSEKYKIFIDKFQILLTILSANYFFLAMLGPDNYVR